MDEEYLEFGIVWVQNTNRKDPKIIFQPYIVTAGWDKRWDGVKSVKYRRDNRIEFCLDLHILESS